MEKTLTVASSASLKKLSLRPPVTVPGYLEETYWWAYLDPRGVRFFERQWLVNLILWGNYARLREAALADIGIPIRGKSLQVACCYGDFTPRLAQALAPESHLDVVDVAPVQLGNLRRKLGAHPRVLLHRQDSANLAFADSSYDQVIVFFLLHEQPEAVRLQTVHEALRVARPGGKIVFVDYPRTHRFNPLRYIMTPVLKWLEPFAMDMWHREIAEYVPSTAPLAHSQKRTYFGGLYQVVAITLQ
jgi:ubiquinone/menaquinone biosynthesis C-methylase UbiE